jgi:RES domain-containing protein
MKPAPNPRYNAFLVELKDVRRPFCKWQGLLFRASCLPHAQTARLLDGTGSLTHGGRWSAAGTLAA